MQCLILNTVGYGTAFNALFLLDIYKADCFIGLHKGCLNTKWFTESWCHSWRLLFADSSLRAEASALLESSDFLLLPQKESGLSTTKGTCWEKRDSHLLFTVPPSLPSLSLYPPLSALGWVDPTSITFKQDLCNYSLGSCRALCLGLCLPWVCECEWRGSSSFATLSFFLSLSSPWCMSRLDSGFLTLCGGER